LEFNVPFQHKYGYIRDDGMLSVVGPRNRALNMDAYWRRLANMTEPPVCGNYVPHRR